MVQIGQTVAVVPPGFLGAFANTVRTAGEVQTWGFRPTEPARVADLLREYVDRCVGLLEMEQGIDRSSEMPRETVLGVRDALNALFSIHRAIVTALEHVPPGLLPEGSLERVRALTADIEDVLEDWTDALRFGGDADELRGALGDHS